MSSPDNPTRTRILDATLDLLESRSAAVVRMADIAKAAKISRQALYLHFPTRAELLVAAVRYVDDIRNVDARLAASRAATGGTERLDLWIAAWGNYIPEIYGVARALHVMSESDPEAGIAWDDRAAAIRKGCEAVVSALASDGALAAGLSNEEAAELLYTLVSISAWEDLCLRAGWRQARFIEVMQRSARAILVA